MKRTHSITITAVVAGLLIALAALLERTLVVDNAGWGDQYDHHFRKQSKRYFGVGFDWRWFKAQGIVESGLRSRARSARGALGVMQILPSTFEEVMQESWLYPDILEPRWNIAAGIAYDRYLYERWRRRVPASQTLSFTLASYNAGFRGISNARTMAEKTGRADQWPLVAPFAPEQTRNYVARIRALMEAPG